MVEAILGWLKLLRGVMSFTRSDVFSFTCRLRFIFLMAGGGGGEADIFPEAQGSSWD